MDGDAIFGVKETISTAADLSARPGIYDFAQVQGAGNAGVHREAPPGGHPVAGLLRRWISASAVILGTIAAAWLGRMFLTRDEMTAQAIPDVIALLVFFLVARAG